MRLGLILIVGPSEEILLIEHSVKSIERGLAVFIVSIVTELEMEFLHLVLWMWEYVLPKMVCEKMCTMSYKPSELFG